MTPGNIGPTLATETSSSISVPKEPETDFIGSVFFFYDFLLNWLC